MLLKVRNIPRADVAELCVQCLSLPEARNRAIDVIALPTEESNNGPQRSPADFKKLIDSLGGANCDYNIHRQV